MAIFSLLAAANGVDAQTPTPIPEPAETPAAVKDEKKPEVFVPISKDPSKPVTAEQVAESSLFIYALPGGRTTLNQIRKTVVERGKISVANVEGKMEPMTYQLFSTRGETSDKDKVKIDLDASTARYALVFAGDRVFGIFNDREFSPREDASQAFQNRVFYSIEKLLRYKEDGSKIEFGGREKMLGVEYFLIDLTDKAGHKMRFYVSTKTFRVMMIDYEDGGVKYRRKFYNYNYAQGTLYPFETALYAGDKLLEQAEVGTVTFGQKVDDAVFTAN